MLLRLWDALKLWWSQPREPSFPLMFGDQEVIDRLLSAEIRSFESNGIEAGRHCTQLSQCEDASTVFIYRSEQGTVVNHLPKIQEEEEKSYHPPNELGETTRRN